MISKKDSVKLKELNEQVRLAVTQAILKVIGTGHTVKILTATEELADLLPKGQNLSIRMSIDIYERDAQ